jgi:hypothetical protein
MLGKLLSGVKEEATSWEIFTVKLLAGMTAMSLDAALNVAALLQSPHVAMQ